MTSAPPDPCYGRGGRLDQIFGIFSPRAWAVSALRGNADLKGVLTDHGFPGGPAQIGDEDHNRSALLDQPLPNLTAALAQS
jgi:hypothetical protein